MAAPVKPRSSPAVPVAPAVAPVAAPVVALARPVAAAPVMPPARPMVAAPVEIDVELVPPSELAALAPAAAEPVIAPRPTVKRSKKGLLIGVAVGAVVLSCGCAGVVGLVVNYLNQ